MIHFFSTYSLEDFKRKKNGETIFPRFFSDSFSMTKKILESSKILENDTHRGECTGQWGSLGM